MTTALQIVNRAAELIGYKDPDEALSGNDAANFLGALNSLLGSWQTRRLYATSVAEVVASVAASPATVGAGQAVDVARPVRLESGCFVRTGGADLPLEVIAREQYAAIADKAAAGRPEVAYYEAGLPTGTLHLWPRPAGAVELHLQVQVPLAEFADLATDYSLAPGYRRALEYSLAEELAPGRRPLDPQIARHAASARKLIKTVNLEVPQLEMPREVLGV